MRPYFIAFESNSFSSMQKSDYKFTVVKEEMDGQVPVAAKTPMVNDLMYMKVIVFPVSKLSIPCRVLKFLNIPKYCTFENLLLIHKTVSVVTFCLT